MKKLLLVLLLAGAACGAACSNSKEGGGPSEPQVEGRFVLHSSLQSGMVLQQNRPFRLWGRSLAGVKVTAAPSWTSQTYSAIVPEGGYWTLEVPVPAAPADNAPQSIVVSTTRQSETLSDLLIGEVWVLGGQSNMEFSLAQAENAQAEIAAADYPLIRFYKAKPLTTASEQYDWRERPEPFYRWYKTSPETAALHSAVGYYFGRMIHEQLGGVPVGLVNTSYGGATAQAFTPLSALEANATLKATYVDPLKEHANPLVRPAEMYNAMIYPLLNLSVRGVCWYQGEGNWDTYKTYPELMSTLIRSWRRGFGIGDLPFYYVQINAWAFGEPNLDNPEFFYSNGPYKEHSGYFYQREAQARTRDEVAHTGMAVSLDVGNPADIHPIWKRPVGERLARLALHDTYGRADVACLGPRYRGHVVENGVVKIAFDHAAGLRTNDSQAPKYFYVALKSDAQFHEAVAEIHGEEIWLTCPEVVSVSTTADDVAIRYAFLLYPVTNLENGEGLPAEPFRTDDWVPTAYSYVY